jgi:hypothetical protein
MDHCPLVLIVYRSALIRDTQEVKALAPNLADADDPDTT